MQIDNLANKISGKPKCMGVAIEKKTDPCS